jgi:hypothetical protein
VQSLPVLGLTVAELRGRKAIGPPDVVPVIDVLAEQDEIAPPLLAQLHEHRIGGRATRAAFRGEEFNDNGILSASANCER